MSWCSSLSREVLGDAGFGSKDRRRLSPGSGRTIRHMSFGHCHLSWNIILFISFVWAVAGAIIIKTVPNLTSNMSGKEQKRSRFRGYYSRELATSDLTNISVNSCFI